MQYKNVPLLCNEATVISVPSSHIKPDDTRRIWRNLVLQSKPENFSGSDLFVYIFRENSLNLSLIHCFHESEFTEHSVEKRNNLLEKKFRQSNSIVISLVKT